jgi:hypothetical protein
MCPKAKGWRVLIHLPHGHVSYATWSIFWISLYPSGINRLVGETLRSRTLRRELRVRLAARLEQSSWRIERRWGGRRNGAVALLSVHTPSKNPHPVSRTQAYIACLLRACANKRYQRALRRQLDYWRTASPRMTLPGTSPFARTLSLRQFTEVQRRAEGMPLGRSIVVLEQLMTDERNLRAIEPELLYHLVSLVLDAPHAQLVSLTVDAF